jgi:hypothetical protein
LIRRFIKESLIRTCLACVSLVIIDRRVSWTNSDIVGLDAFSGIFRIDYFGLTAALAELSSRIESRCIRSAFDVFAEVICVVEVAIIIAKFAFACGLVVYFSIGEDAHAAGDCTVYDFLAAQTRLADSSVKIEYLVYVANSACLAAQVVETAVWTVEANLLIVPHERGFLGTVGQIVGH